MAESDWIAHESVVIPGAIARAFWGIGHPPIAPQLGSYERPGGTLLPLQTPVGLQPPAPPHLRFLTLLWMLSKPLRAQAAAELDELRVTIREYPAPNIITPSDTESRIIRNLAGGWRKDLAQSTEEIDRLHSLIDEATRKRNELNQFIDAHLALVSPARRLPDDVIREIFMATLSSSRNSPMSLKEAPLLLRQICHSWSSIALSYEQYRELCLSTSRWPTRWKRMPVATSHLSCLRWLVSLPVGGTLPLPGISHHFASLSSADVPLLRNITMDQPGEWATELFTFLGTESLRSLQLQNNKSTLLLQRYYSGARSSKRAILCGGNHLGGGFEPVSLPHLTHLSVTYGHETSNVPRLFGSLILPALSTFHCCDENTKLLFLHSRTLFPSGTSNLQCFWINLRDLNSLVLVAPLNDMPNLHELHILREPFDSQNRFPDRKSLLRLGTDAGGPVCPRLQHLALEQFEELSDGTLLQFLQSRAPSIAQSHQTGEQLQTVVPLSHFSCSFERPRDRDIMPDLQDAIAAGLVVELKYLMLEEDGYSPFEGIDMEGF
ncbi:hypothetical protein C8R47DRAFT_1201542 [Mycena vitilis]|nr:hypothetical protein C8R47DRAFT_1201542 [Mycena vitilis]